MPRERTAATAGDQPSEKQFLFTSAWNLPCKFAPDSSKLACVKDLGTRHGTWMGTRKVNDESLRAGDVVKIGSTRLAYFPAGQSARK